jgi:hypothetical protein
MTDVLRAFWVSSQELKPPRIFLWDHLGDSSLHSKTSANLKVWRPMMTTVRTVSAVLDVRELRSPRNFVGPSGGFERGLKSQVDDDNGKRTGSKRHFASLTRQTHGRRSYPFLRLHDESENPVTLCLCRSCIGNTCSMLRGLPL